MQPARRTHPLPGTRTAITLAAAFAAAAALAIALLLTAAAAPAGAATHHRHHHRACHGALLAPTPATLRRARRATRCLLNRARRRAGLRTLRADRRLRHAARGHSSDMRRRHYFDHVTPGGVSPAKRIRRSGYRAHGGSWTVGENIAWGSGPYATPRSTVRSWMRSAPHRANILSPRYRAVGVGIALGSPISGRGATYTTDFGSR